MPQALPDQRVSALAMTPQQFQTLGHALVDRIAAFLHTLPSHPVTTGESPSDIRAALDADRALPQQPADPAHLLNHAADLLLDHSLFNGHPRFWGYITSSAAPIGALADLLAAAINPNTGAWLLSPMASEIEAQTIRWIAEMLAYPTTCGGLFVSGGNMANILCILAARQAKAGFDVRAGGLANSRLRMYCSAETHTWVQKAADITGLGTDAIRWIPADANQRLNLTLLRRNPHRRPRRRRPALPRHRHRRHRQHRRHRSPARTSRPVQRIQSLVPYRRSLRSARRRPPQRSISPRRHPTRRLHRSRPSQVALRSPRSRLRPRSQSPTPPRRLRLPSPLLPLRHRGHQLLRPRPPKLPRLPRPQSLARPPASWPRRLRPNALRRHLPRPHPL